MICLFIFLGMCGIGVCIWNDQVEKRDIDDEIQSLIDKRQQARANKDWATADAIRDELKAKGIILEDTKDGVRWKKA